MIYTLLPLILGVEVVRSLRSYMSLFNRASPGQAIV